ncbi:MAG: SDR family oxidoreductase [Desulfobacterales bacterium]
MTEENKLTPPATPVAIIGIGCFFPKSPGLKEFWRLIVTGENAIGEVPATHWTAEDYFDADPAAPDHTYCKRGGFLPPVMFDPTEFGIPPALLEATDTSQLLGLMAAKMALADAGYGDGKTFNRAKTSVILGVTGTQELVIPLGARLGFPHWRRALEHAGVAPATVADVLSRISDAYVPWQEGSFPGLLGNVVAGRICNRLDLGGTNCVVDAACASSMSAMHMAILELAAGRSDMVVTGGIDTLNDIFMHMCFAKTRILSPTGDARPFSKDADGTVLGEGVGLLVIKRLADAEKDGDRIYAVIRGIGSASDGKSQSIYAPRPEGQVQALQSAYANAGIDPHTVELIEAHGTGTRVGDKVEFQALSRVFGDRNTAEPDCAIGSVKSMIGHTKAAAGAAGLIKSVLALHHKILPPTLKAEQPDPELGIDSSRFYLNTVSRPWLPRPDHPRRCGVSAFGFGGSNFHVVLEEYGPEKTAAAWDGSVDIVAVSAASKAELRQKILRLKSEIEGGLPPAEASFQTRRAFRVDDACRLLWVVEPAAAADPLPDSLPTDFFQEALALLDDHGVGTPANRPDLFYGEGRPGGKLAFLFPGQGSQYPGMGRDLVCRFPNAFEAFAAADGGLDGERSLSRAVYPLPASSPQQAAVQAAALRRTDMAQPAIGAVSLALLAVLAGFGVRPDATAGHSFGELTALHAAGWIDRQAFISLASARGRLMASAGSSAGADGSGMLAVQAPLAKIEALIKSNRLDLVLANRNAPRQGVLAGSNAALAAAQSICRAKGYGCVSLSVAAGFHSKYMEKALQPFQKALRSISLAPTAIPVFSNTTGGPYPADAERAAALMGDHLRQPVAFTDEIKHLHAAGIRTFLEIGPRSILSGLVADILSGEPFEALAVDASAGKRSGLSDLARTLCRLAAIGHPVDLGRWEDAPPRPGTRKPLMQIPLTGTNYRSPRRQKRGQPSDSTPPARTDEHHARAASIDPVPFADKTPNGRAPLDIESTNMMKKPVSPQPIDPPSQRTVPPVTTDATWIHQALATLQQGLSSMQALQQQTAETHQKFLEAQIQAGRTLQTMMEHTRHLAAAATGPVEMPAAVAIKEPAHPITAPASEFSSRSTPGLKETLDPAPFFGGAAEKPPSAAVAETDARPGTPDATPSGAPSPGLPAAIELQRILMEVVSDLTGYPVEMIKPDMDIEADLGIDSIKRVEILSTIEERVPGLPAVAPAVIGKMKTLGQVADLLLVPQGRSPETEPAHDQAAPTAAAAAQPVETDRKALMNALIEVVGELTGYPIEMIDAGMDIEADLGIDSIKRVEILSAMEEKLPGLHSVSPADMGRLKTLAQIADYLGAPGHESLPDAPPPETLTQGASPATAAAAAVTPPMEADASLRRQVVKIVATPSQDRKEITIAAGRKVFITEDDSGLAAALAGELARRHIETDLIPPAGIENLVGVSPAGGLILISSAKTPTTADDLQALFGLASRFGPGLMQTAASEGAVFASVTRMDGAFGFHGRKIAHPLQGALAGLTKTADLEWEGVHCRAIDLAPDWSDLSAAAAAVADALLHRGPEDPVEIGLAQNGRWSLALEEAPLPADAVTDRILEAGDVVVVSGGARGVTAAAAIALAARLQPKLILLGRSPAPQPEPFWLKTVTGEAAIKKAILKHEFGGGATPAKLESAFHRHMANREIAASLAAIRETGAEAHYYRLDVREVDDVHDIMAAVAAEHGPVRAIIHGAGVIEDRLIVDQKPENFARVFDTKVKGLENLLAAADEAALRHLVLFSSVTARLGNRGQAAYAMANEALNKIARRFALDCPQCRVKAINWGPWEGGMVSAGLGHEFRRRGVDLIPIAGGARHLVEEMGRAEDPDIEVVVGAPIPRTAARPALTVDPPIAATGDAKAEPELSLTFHRDLDLGNHPVLRSHVIDGTAVVPLALMTEWFAHGALHGNPGLRLQGLDDLRVLKGIKLDRETKHIRLMAGKARPSRGAFEVPLELRDGVNGSVEVIHSRARAILADELAPAPPYRIPARLARRPYNRSIAEVYDQILFHGPDMRGLRGISHLSAAGMVADVAAAPAPSAWVKEPLRNRWLLDPLALDAAFQMATIWCFEEKGAAALPSYCAAYRQYRSRFPAEGVTAVLEVTAAGTHKMQGNVTFLDRDGMVVAQMTGCEAIMDPALQKVFRPAAA